jgi:serine/threonine protein kinase
MKRVLGVMQPVTAALHYAHQSGFVHCDVKPANIMLHKTGNILVADFGISRMSEAATVTMAGAGTPAYMSPEQIMGDMPTPQMDIYAMGVILFEMLTGGERPFTGDNSGFTGTTAEKIRWEQRNLEAPSPREYNPSISPALEKVVLTCLQKQPSVRYKTALDLYVILKKFSDAVTLPMELVDGKKSPIVTIQENKNIVVMSPPIISTPVLQGDAGPVDIEKKTRQKKQPQSKSTPISKVRPKPKPITSRIAKLKDSKNNFLTRLWELLKSLPRVTWAVVGTLLFIMLIFIFQTPATPTVEGIDGIYFASDRTGEMQIFHIGNKGLRQITTKSNNFEAVRGSQGIYFTSERSGKREVYHLSNSGDTRQITSTGGDAESWYPMPYGGGTYFVSNRSGKAEIYYIGKDGIRQVTSTPGNYVSLYPAPSSTGLYFSSDRSGKSEVFFMDHKAKITQVTHTKSGLSGIAAPFNNGFYYVSDRDGENLEVYYMDSKGSVIQITNTSVNVLNLNPFPTSNGLYFISDRTGVFELYHLDKKGSLLQVTKSPENTFSFIGSLP